MLSNFIFLLPNTMIGIEKRLLYELTDEIGYKKLIMRIILVISITITCYLTMFLSGCSDCRDNWEYLGNENVGIYQIFCPDTISAVDSLSLDIHGNLINGDKYHNVDLDIERNTNSLLFELSADIFSYIGCYIIPPTDLMPHVDTILLPPFNEGGLALIVNQPTGLDTLGEVIVQP
jgi:hypothetical protein